MQYREHTVPRGRYRIYARDYPGEEPEIVLMHGFPDDLHLYDRLVPRLSSRWVVVFDFLGWGRSDKPEGYPYRGQPEAGPRHRYLAPGTRGWRAGGSRCLGTDRDRLGASARGQDWRARAVEHLL